MSQENNSGGLIDEILGWLVKAVLRRWTELGVLLGVYCAYEYLSKHLVSLVINSWKYRN